MNPLFNPFICLPLAKSLLFDPKRILKKNQRQIQRYKDKAFKYTVKQAFNVPLYHDIYKKANIHPSDISGIKDIEKLPIITKKDIIENFPDRILPKSYNKNNAHIICTGGTTGKPVCLYTDFFSIGKGAMLPIRELLLLKLPWKKVRVVHIGNFNPYRIDLVAKNHFYAHMHWFQSKGTQLNIDVNSPIKKIIESLDAYKPDVIMTYPATFQHLAYLKRKGYGKQINPQLCWTGGAMLDDYTRSYVQDAFQCRLLNIYPSVEAGADIAFECYDGTWHVHDDFFHLEAIDEENNAVSSGERGHILLTKLWGTTTPIIRYSGMDDWVRLSDPKSCSCGLQTTTIIGGVEGRKRANIVLPSGKVFPPGAFCFITPVLNELKTFKVKQYQIIQQSLTEVEILLVIDESLRNVGPSVELIKQKIKTMYENKVGPTVDIHVKEVAEIKHPKDARKPPPIVISHVKASEGYTQM